MKKIVIAFSLLAIACQATQASAEDDCKISLCMFGYLKGENDSTCKGAISEYFSILVYKHGKLKWSQTASKRLSQLQSCSEADPGMMKEVNSKFGRSRG